jgi:uncharacterized membrane protein YphA (DoxX/SURF4 family)/thiol-disulfide isomerase/thioredoxin
MDLILALIRLVLSLIFGLAGITKLLDQPGTRSAVVNFGAPEQTAPRIAIALPVVELLIMLGLLFNATAWWSAVGALVSLSVFIVVIAVNLAQGRTHDCHCFGQLHSRPLGWPTVVRNAIFAALAIVLIWKFRPNAYPPIHTTILAAVANLNVITAVLLAVALTCGVAALVFWQRRKPEKTIEEAPLPIDSPAPHFEIESYEGGKRSLSELLRPGKPLLLLFTNPKCGPCIGLFQEVKDWQDSHGNRLTIALISRGSIKDNFVSVAKNGLGEVLLQENAEIARLFRAAATPTGILVNQESRIASFPAAGAQEIRKLLESVIGHPVSKTENAESNGS